MTYTINGKSFREMLNYGIINLTNNRDEVNALNVFPVPDGDTGTNMVLTLKNGCAAMEENAKLSENAKKFAQAIIYGARGNSGVILSQFFKGFAECFCALDEADAFAFCIALKKGVKCAYSAVSNPAEGTILTVMRESCEYTTKKISKGRYETIDEIFSSLLKKAKSSLEKTPELLPILKSAGVVDSGGAGLVYIFEGICKYLNGEKIELRASGGEIAAAQLIDYSLYNEDSVFDFGYCTELLLQILKGKKRFNYESFVEKLSDLGDSIVTSFNDGKVKIHIHTKEPEEVFALGHKYGEFLTVKVENMSVQHNELKENKPHTGISVYQDAPKGSFSVLCVAHDTSMRDCFMNMGADIVILGDRLCPPSASDFVEAFERTTTKTIFVFSNGKNTYLSAVQASKLYSKANVVVINSKSDTECYSCLPMIDFSENDHESVEEAINEIIANIKTVTVSVSVKESVFDGQEIKMGELFAFTGEKLLSVGNDHVSVATKAIKNVMDDGERDVITLFVSPNVMSEAIDEISAFINESYIYTELVTVETNDEFYDIVISFE